MTKQKTHKGLQKRIKVTASGKLKHKRCCGGHLMSKKNSKRRRAIAGKSLISGAAAKSLKARLHG
jgi:large subunit ribosomal protein L35